MKKSELKQIIKEVIKEEKIYLTEALSPIDKKAVDCFYKKKPFVGKFLTTDGEKLIGKNGQTLCKWKGLILFISAVVDTKFTASTLRYIKKTFPERRISTTTPISDFI